MESEHNQLQQRTSKELLQKTELNTLTAVRTFQELFNCPVKVISSPTYNRMELATLIEGKCFQFLNTNSPADNNAQIAEQFADDILETRLDWKPQDIDLFFKTIRQRQDIEQFKVFGNKVTGIKLSEMILAYEDLRAEAKEQHLKTKFKEPENEKVNVDVAKYTKPILDRLRPVYEEPVKRELTDVELLFQETINDFDTLRRVQGQTGRFAEVDGKQMNIDDYLNYRLENHESQKINS